jgi:hypothetical protein
MIANELQDPTIMLGNVYNMDETRIMLSMLGSVKVLVRKDNRRNYKSVGVKRKMVTAIKCISADGQVSEPNNNLASVNLLSQLDHVPHP